MRLSKEQVRDIKEAVKVVLSGVGELASKIYLVGSRTKDHLKGGDIDLLILVEPQYLEASQRIKLILTNEIMKKKSIDETKVDVIFAVEKDLEADAFVSTLRDSMVSL